MKNNNLFIILLGIIILTAGQSTAQTITPAGLPMVINENIILGINATADSVIVEADNGNVMYGVVNPVVNKFTGEKTKGTLDLNSVSSFNDLLRQLSPIYLRLKSPEGEYIEFVNAQPHQAGKGKEFQITFPSSAAPVAELNEILAETNEAASRWHNPDKYAHFMNALLRRYPSLFGDITISYNGQEIIGMPYFEIISVGEPFKHGKGIEYHVDPLTGKARVSDKSSEAVAKFFKEFYKKGGTGNVIQLYKRYSVPQGQRGGDPLIGSEKYVLEKKEAFFGVGSTYFADGPVIQKSQEYVLDGGELILFDQATGHFSGIIASVPVNGNSATPYQYLLSNPDHKVVAATDNGAVRELVLQNGDIIKFSAAMGDTAFDGILHVEGGVLRISNDGQNAHYDFDFTNDGPYNGMTLKDVNIRLNYAAATPLHKDAIAFVGNAAKFENEVNANSKFEMTATKEPVVRYNGALMTQSKAAELQEEKRREEEQQRLAREEQLRQQREQQLKQQQELEQKRQELQAERDRQLKITNEVIGRLYAIYGKPMVDRAVMGQIVPAMPWGLIKQVFNFQKVSEGPDWTKYRVYAAPLTVDPDKKKLVPRQQPTKYTVVEVVNEKVTKIGSR